MYEKCRRQSLMQDFLFGLFAPCRWTSCAKDAAPTISARATWRWATSLARGPPPPTSSLHWPSEYLAEPGLIRYIATDSDADKHRFNSHNSNMTKDWINECIVLIKCFLKVFFFFFLRKLLSLINCLCHVFFFYSVTGEGWKHTAVSGWTSPKLWTAVSKSLFLLQRRGRCPGVVSVRPAVGGAGGHRRQHALWPPQPLRGWRRCSCRPACDHSPTHSVLCGLQNPTTGLGLFKMNSRNLKLVCVSDCVDVFCPKTPGCLQMRCQANTNGSQVECDLGNPMKRDTKVREEPTRPVMFVMSGVKCLFE